MCFLFGPNLEQFRNSILLERNTFRDFMQRTRAEMMNAMNDPTATTFSIYDPVLCAEMLDALNVVLQTIEELLTPLRYSPVIKGGNLKTQHKYHLNAGFHAMHEAC
jgi:hypothetical protein